MTSSCHGVIIVPPSYSHALMALRRSDSVVLVSVDTVHRIPVPTPMYGLTHQPLAMRIHHLSLCNLSIEHSKGEGIYTGNRVWSLILMLFPIQYPLQLQWVKGVDCDDP